MLSNLYGGQLTLSTQLMKPNNWRENIHSPHELSRDLAIVFNPLTPMRAVTSIGLSSTSDVITFDQNWHHLCSTSAGGKDLSSDAQIRVISRTEPEICTKMLKTWSEKLTKICCHHTWLLHGKSCVSMTLS